ncbi:hypothetical protein NC652_011639 [Populus alba x Populus x berolinensis]|nr:hypothetical protein NC652_011639 [Populus alba x Populus x berolinensis]
MPGVINGAAPNLVRLAEMCERLGNVMAGRRGFLQPPDFDLKAVLGEGATAVRTCTPSVSSLFPPHGTVLKQAYILSSLQNDVLLSINRLIVKAEVRTVPGQAAELEEHEKTTLMVPGLKIMRNFQWKCWSRKEYRDIAWMVANNIPSLWHNGQLDKSKSILLNESC